MIKREHRNWRRHSGVSREAHRRGCNLQVRQHEREAEAQGREHRFGSDGTERMAVRSDLGKTPSMECFHIYKSKVFSSSTTPDLREMKPDELFVCFS